MGARMKRKKEDNKKKFQFMLFSIRNKVVFCFVLPIIFMIIIGATAYHKAAEGMRQKYEESTLQTMQMATEYIDESYKHIEEEALKYAWDTEVNKYMMGLYDDNPLGASAILTELKNKIWSSQAINAFVQDIHIITRSDIVMVSTKTSSGKNGIFEKYYENIEKDSNGDVCKWTDRHEALDEYLSLADEEYIMCFQTLNQTKSACVVIDISSNAIEQFLNELDLGKNSIVGFITPSGREIICEDVAEGQDSVLAAKEKVFWGKEFFVDIEQVHTDNTEHEKREDISGTKEVMFQGKPHLFIYSRSVETGTTMCVLVPISTITSQAAEIKSLTVKLIFVASCIALVIGILTVIGIQKNMKRISKKFGEVAKGDLTVQIYAKGRDEFRGLAFSANDMVGNTKKLVNKVSRATELLETSANDVNSVSSVIDKHFKDITGSIDEINKGMTRQARHAQECVNKTDLLSQEIQMVSRVVEQVETLVCETEAMIKKGMYIVQTLGDRASETTNIAAQVSKNIEALRRESEIINTFVETITEISEQTNLLSLNASIEAARAGESGRGFAVVAEEIRKLADDSGNAAYEIRNKVTNISEQTFISVESANHACEMVELQAGAVEEVTAVFQEMRVRMEALIEGLKDIAVSIQRADNERDNTVTAVKNISDIIEETAASAERVSDVANQLLHNVEKLNSTASILDENMEGLMTEVSQFKI